MTQLLLYLTLFLVCFVAVTQTRQQDNFYFDPAPIDRDVVEGDEIRLRCDVSSRRHIEFYWTQSDRQVDNTSRRFQEDSDLRITRVDRRHDSGPFRCIATNVTTGVSLQSTTARLNILCKYIIFLVSNDRMLVQCSANVADGGPALTQRCFLFSIQDIVSTLPECWVISVNAGPLLSNHYANAG